MNNREVLQFAAEALGTSIKSVSLLPVHGGDINQTFKATGEHGDSLFLKVNHIADILASEANSLRKIRELNVRCYPEVRRVQTFDDGICMALEFVELSDIDATSSSLLAKTLQAQHSITADQFGWFEDGYIGYSKQFNEWNLDWISFFRDMRLLPQLRQARDNSLSMILTKKIENVMLHLSHYIDPENIKPSLLHGDLWTGNVALNVSTQRPFLFDPAPYFGDPEVDIAMTSLFGSLPQEFYNSYVRDKLDETLNLRHAVYNLYHALNHFNLFGSGYTGMVEKICTKLSFDE